MRRWQLQHSPGHLLPFSLGGEDVGNLSQVRPLNGGSVGEMTECYSCAVQWVVRAKPTKMSLEAIRGEI